MRFHENQLVFQQPKKYITFLFIFKLILLHNLQLVSILYPKFDVDYHVEIFLNNQHKNLHIENLILQQYVLLNDLQNKSW